MGIDHGQLNSLRKHAVVAEERPWIIDFESASTGRKPTTVTTADQHLFVGGRPLPCHEAAIGLRDTTVLKKLVGDYKRDLSDH